MANTDTRAVWRLADGNLPIDCIALSVPAKWATTPPEDRCSTLPARSPPPAELAAEAQAAVAARAAAAAAAAAESNAPLIATGSAAVAASPPAGGTTAPKPKAGVVHVAAYEWGERLADGLACALATSYGWQRKAGAGMLGVAEEILAREALRQKLRQQAQQAQEDAAESGAEPAV